MNYLAHALLAGPLAADRVGGVIGDFVKGPIVPGPGWLPGALAPGVVLHRRIDSFADADPAFCRSRARVSAARRRVAGIIVDMVYDHFLALHWARFSEVALAAFTTETYQQIRDQLPCPPAEVAGVLQRMAEHDWLASYRDPANVALALDRMARFRLRQPNPLAGAGDELLRDYAGFEADCLDFLPRALAFADAVRAAR